jgi:2-aminoadipate transaminase
MKNSAIRDLFKYLGIPGIISFAGGLPAPETFPKWRLFLAMSKVLLNPKKLYTAWQYGPTEGYKPLREHLAKKVNKYGVPAEAGNILLTCGSQQALDLIGKIFVDENTVILTEQPTYLGALQAWDSYGAKYCTVPMDENGIMVDLLPEIIEKYHPKFMYVIPNFHNPAGVCMSLERREKIVEIAEKYDMFIVEDDPYGDIRFEGEHITPIVSLAKERTLYLCTFSKTLAPGVRTGWVVAPKEAILKLVQAKQGADLFSSMVLQMTVSEFCESGRLPDHVKNTRALYRGRRDTMVNALKKYAPKGVTWTHPSGGLFLWLTVPDKINVPEFFHIAIEQKVAFVPGRAFYPYEIPESLHTMRLNFSLCKSETIDEGIKLLCETIEKELMK